MAVRVDFDRALLNVFGEDETDRAGRIVRLGFVCSFALGQTWQGDKRDDQQKDNDWRLALKIGKSGGKKREDKGDEVRFGELDLTNKEASHIADVARAVYPGPAYGSQIVEMLEGVPKDAGDGEDK